MTCFLDTKGFLLQREFVIKEIAVVCEEGKIYHVWTIRPPCRFERLPVNDQYTVKHESNFNLGLAWDDGSVPYHHMPFVFVHIAREFKNWIVENDNIKKIVFPYKSQSVQIKILPVFDKDADDDDAGIKYPKICCLYSHPNCAVQTATRLLNLYKENNV